MKEARTVTTGRTDSRQGFDLSLFITRYGTIFALIVLAIAFAFASGNFLAQRNLINILRQVSVLLVISSGVTIAVAAGEFDLSVGQLASMAAILSSGLMIRQEQPAWLACLVALAAGAFFGLLNGLLVTRARIPALICTIGTGLIAVGVNFGYGKGDSIYGRTPPEFVFIGQGSVGPIPFSVILAFITWALLYFFLNHTRRGRYIVATGGNATAARLSGIKIANYRRIGLFISAMCAAVGGLILTSYLGAGQPNGGDPYTVRALSVVFLGMTTIKPGQSNMLGTLIGVLIIGILDNGLNLIGSPFYMQNIIRGIVLIFAVSLAVSREEIRLM